MIKYYNKLVRDKIPEIIEASGKKANYKVLNDPKEFKAALISKIVEEANEVASAKNEVELVEELADLELAIASLKQHLKLGSGLTASAEKMNAKGSFYKRIFLISVEEEDS